MAASTPATRRATAPRPDEAHRAAGDLAERCFAAGREPPPGRASRRTVELGEPPQSGQHQGDRHLGDRRRVRARHVAHRDAAPGSLLEIDGVHAHSDLLDEPEPRRPCHYVGGHGIEHVEEHVGLGEACEKGRVLAALRQHLGP
jgi:hypothetical protein